MRRGGQGWGPRGIAEPSVRKHLRVRRQAMELRVLGAEDVPHLDAPGRQRVSDELAVAPRGEGFGAQDGRRPPLGKFDQPHECRAKRRCAHVVGVAAKARVLPTGIRRVPARRATAAEVGLVPVRDSRRCQRPGERLPREVWVAARRRIAPHIHDLFHAVRG